MFVATLVGVIGLMFYRRCRATHFLALMPDGNRLSFDLRDITLFEVDEAIGNLT